MTLSQEDIQKFQDIVNNLAIEFQKVKPTTGWFTFSKQEMEDGIAVVFSGIKQLVHQAAQTALAGADKKALVLEYANKLFDAIIAPQFPILLMPVIPVVRNLLDSFLSQVIELVVEKL